MSFEYNLRVSEKAKEIISSIDTPGTYDESFFREGLFCEFSPLTNDFICCWCFDIENSVFWLNQGKEWVRYENVETDSLASHLLETIPDLEEIISDATGYGIVMETLFKLKAGNR